MLAAHQKTAQYPDIILRCMVKLGLSPKWAPLPEFEEIMTTYRTVKPEVAAGLMLTSVISQYSPKS